MPTIGRSMTKRSPCRGDIAVVTTLRSSQRHWLGRVLHRFLTGSLLVMGHGVDMARADDGTIHAVINGEVRCPLAAVRAVLLDLEGFGNWFPAVARWQVLARRADSARVYGRHRAPWPYRDRDYVVDYRWQTLPGGALQLDARASTGGEPADAGVIRIEKLHSRWTIAPVLDGTADRTAVRYEITSAPPTRSPRWLERAAQRRAGEQLVAALASELARREPSCKRQTEDR